jgi:hypothetical protein
MRKISPNNSAPVPQSGITHQARLLNLSDGPVHDYSFFRPGGHHRPGSHGESAARFASEFACW